MQAAPPDGGTVPVRYGLPLRQIFLDGVVMRCVHWRRVPLDLMREAQEKLTGNHIDRAVQCQLPMHDGDHFGLLGDGGMCGTALWFRWHGMSEVELVVLPDCPARDGEGCCLFADHAMQHTWEDAPEETPCTS